VNRRADNPFKGWIAAGRGIGFFLLLAGGSAALGFVIAWPLWLFATSERKAYTVFVLCLLGAGVVALLVRSAARRRRAARDQGGPRRTALSALITFVQVVVVVAGIWGEAVFIARGLWLFSVVGLLAWASIVWALGIGRRAAKTHKQAAVPAENKGE
jgi:hypothetical protein